MYLKKIQKSSHCLLSNESYKSLIVKKEAVLSWNNTKSTSNSKPKQKKEAIFIAFFLL
jgi:hypothetical protein